MKAKIFLFTFFITIIFSFGNVNALNENFEITNYKVKMIVNEDNSYEITETIDVKFNTERHGIIRSIPLRTNTGKTAGITDVNVEGNKYETSVESGNYYIKIGDPDKFANMNESYIITYTFHMGNDYVEGYDELYFNLIGLEWDVYIRNSSFEIIMPKEFDTSKINFTYGKANSTENSEVTYKVQNNTITGKLNTELRPNEGLTVALPLLEGYFIKNVPVLGEFIRKDYNVIYLIVTLIAILLWGLIGKNRRIFPTVEFYPPNGLTPTDMGFIYDGEINPYDVTALIIYWADRGFIEIEQQDIKAGFLGKRKKKKILLHKLKPIDENSKEYEKTMFEALFKNAIEGRTVSIDELKYEFYSTVVTVKSSVKSLWQGNKKSRIYSYIAKPLAVLINLFALIAAIATGYGIIYKYERGFFSDIIIFAVMVGVVMFLPVVKISGLIHKWKKMLPRNRVKPLLKYGILLLITAGFGLWNMNYDMRLMLASGYITCFAITLLAQSIAKRTKIGDSFMEKILGFKDFIIYAEKDRINKMVEENPKYFFNVLPYAMVLGITDKWAKKFEKITIEPPSWYKADNGQDYFNCVDFAYSMVDNTALMVDVFSATVSSSSSGSDGGGSYDGGEAGGGSGGGGGDDW